ncbi:hypothetical protein ACA910_006417 [Epithemia clementina (nom. ined.)]
MIGFRSLFVAIFLALAVSYAHGATQFRGDNSERKLQQQVRALQEGVEEEPAAIDATNKMMGSNYAKYCARKCLKKKDGEPIYKIARCYYRCTKKRSMMMRGCEKCDKRLPRRVCKTYRFICTKKLCKCPESYGSDEEKCNEYLEKNCPCNCPVSVVGDACQSYQDICFKAGGTCKCRQGRKSGGGGESDLETTVLAVDSSTCEEYKSICSEAMMMDTMMGTGMGTMMGMGMMGMDDGMTM